MAKQRHVDRVHHFLVVGATANGTPREVEPSKTDEIGFAGISAFRPGSHTMTWFPHHDLFVTVRYAPTEGATVVAVGRPPQNDVIWVLSVCGSALLIVTPGLLGPFPVAAPAGGRGVIAEGSAVNGSTPTQIRRLRSPVRRSA